MLHHHRGLWIAVACGWAVCAAASPSFAEWEPTKPIKIIVGYAPGGGSDIIARTLVAAGQEFFPVPIVVVNKAGAGGTLGADMVAKSKPDGYTLMIGGGSETSSVPNFRELTYKLTDFQGVIRCTRSRNLLVTRADSGIKTFKDLVTQAQASPNKLTYGSTGQGGIYHATMLVVTGAAKIQMSHIPYGGGAPEVAALLGGHIQLAVNAPEEIEPQVQAKAVNLIALTSDDRYPGYPDVPTLKELGYDVYIENQKGLVAPAGLPDDVYKYLHDHFKQAMDSVVWTEMAKKLQLETSYLSGPDFMKSMVSMSQNIAKAIKAQ